MKWLVFTGLKIVEGLAIVFLPYWIGLWNPINFDMSDPSMPSGLFGVWFWGILNIFLAFGVGIFGFFIIQGNWELTKRFYSGTPKK